MSFQNQFIKVKDLNQCSKKSLLLLVGSKFQVFRILHDEDSFSPRIQSNDFGEIFSIHK